MKIVKFLLCLIINLMAGYCICYYVHYINSAHLVSYYFSPYGYFELDEDEIKKVYGEDCLRMLNHIKDMSIYGDLKTKWKECLNKADEVRFSRMKDTKIKIEVYCYYKVHSPNDKSLTKYSIVVFVDQKHKIIVGAFVSPSTY